MADIDIRTTRPVARAIFELVNMEGETLVCFYQWDNGDVFVVSADRMATDADEEGPETA